MSIFFKKFSFQNPTKQKSASTIYNFGLAALGKASTLTWFTIPCALISAQANAAQLFINEIHYDNIGSDVAEGVELVGLPGLDISGWSLAFYNGSDGSIYKQHEIDQAFKDSAQQASILHLAISGLQNGPADGVALLNSLDEVVEFLSYEGGITATSGAAAGLTSTTITATESSSTELGFSLQRHGDFSYNGEGFTIDTLGWKLAASTWGLLNDGQALITNNTAVPLPASLPFYALATGGIFFAKRRRTGDKTLAH